MASTYFAAKDSLRGMLKYTPFISRERPALLETYTTLVIQAMDLGVLVPLGIITGTRLLMRNAWRYALASVFLIKPSSPAK
ncbi:hypothetical protein [Methanocella conradii]|uniref:hypothetical protein n=1 Tax=Methanocella conradii TaxID=1175444 RepID=UPI00157BE8E1|nr:hypothetical protein [Methanocella conradii]